MASKTHLYALFFSFFILGIHAVTITVKNSCRDTIWPGVLSSSGGESTTGFELAGGGATTNIEVPPNWNAGRIWGRTGCSGSGGTLICQHGDCANRLQCQGSSGVPPVSLAEFTLTGNDNKDNYDISLVDGFNLPLKITPNRACTTLNCAANLNDGCPAGLAIDGACKSDCTAFNEDRYCCRGAFNSAATCPPSESTQYFESRCPDAYSYAYDDASSLATCSPGGVTQCRSCNF